VVVTVTISTCESQGTGITGVYNIKEHDTGITGIYITSEHAGVVTV